MELPVEQRHNATDSVRQMSTVGIEKQTSYVSATLNMLKEELNSQSLLILAKFTIAILAVIGEKKHDGYIRFRTESRHVMPSFETKKQYRVKNIETRNEIRLMYICNFCSGVPNTYLYLMCILSE